MKITVAEVRPEGIRERAFEIEDVPAGEDMTVAHALECLKAEGVVVNSDDGLSIFAKRVRPEEPIHAGDRLEITGALLCDPKAARRRHAEAQGDVRIVTRGRHGGRHQLAKKSAE